MSTPSYHQRDRRWPRRTFMTTFGSLAAAAWLPRSVAAGNSQIAARGAPAIVRPEPTPNERRAAAQQSNTLTYAYLWPTKVIDPHSPHDNPTLVALSPMYEGLLGYKSGTMELEPVLASSYEVAPDGMTYTFKLRPNVAFHDGAMLNAAAVRTSYERMFKLGKSPSASVQQYVRSIDTPDAATVVVNMARPYAPTLAALGQAFIVSPKALETHAADDAVAYLSENAAGTGPYTLSAWARDQSLTLTRFQNYWRGWSGKPIDTVVIRFVAEQATQRQLIQRAEAQLAMAISVDDLAQLKADPKMRVYTDPSVREYLIRFDNQRPPLDDLRVRQALVAAFDYEAGVEQILLGNGSIPQGYVPTQYRSHNKSLAPEQSDLRQAKQLLEAAGVSTVNLSCTYIGNLDIQRQAAELWQATLAQIGVTVRLNPQPWATMVERSKSADSRDNSGFFAFNYAYPDETLAQWSTLASNTNAAWGAYGYKNDRIDELLNNALTIVDDEERIKTLRAAQQAARDDAATVNLWIFNDWVVATDSLKGYRYDPSRPTIPRFYELSFE